MMDPAISTTFNFDLPLPDMMAMIRRAGFQLISLSGGNYEKLGYLKACGRETIHGLCRKHGIKVDSIHAPLGNTIDISHPDICVRGFSVQLMKQAIHACTELHCSIFIAHLSGRFREDDLPDRIVGARHSLEELIPYAKHKNVHVALENLICPASNRLFRIILAEIDDPAVGVCLDTSHAHVTKQLYALIKDYGSRIIAVHISDSKGMLDDHMLPHEGTIEWGRFVTAFSTVVYNGSFLLEVEMRESVFRDPEVFLDQAYIRGQAIVRALKATPS